ncbi:hypothetical protein GE09DRAFT_202187 [Coniochaeta sp. 2T2.1]|nr:hypothetical protein GE09DRAFT_202187 [Coniochaeta sp. 2T2.1]
MLLKPLTFATAGLVAAAQAFLLPPTVSESDIDIVNSLPDVDALSVPQHIHLNVTCPGCLQLAQGKHHDFTAAVEKPSHLELAFSIDHTSDGDRLVVNGFPLYPKANPFISTLKSAVVPNDGLRPAIKELRGHRPRTCPAKVLGYQLAVRQQAASQEDGLALYSLDLQIIEVGDVFVNGIPNVHIQLVKDITTGALVIGSIETTQSETADDTPAVTLDEECTTFVCKWMTSMKDAAKKMKGKCHGKMRGGAHGARPHHGGHHGGHHGHQGRPHRMDHHSWGRLLKDIGQHVLLPVAVGIIAGISVSLIGMMVGTLIVSVWRVFFRRPSQRRHSHSPHKAPMSEEDAADGEEKSGLMEHQDPPPTYDAEAATAPPSYEEGAAPKTSV